MPRRRIVNGKYTRAISKYHVRWMVRRDMAEVLNIEKLSFEFPWFEDDFIRVLRQKNAIAMIAEAGDRVVGFKVYELFKNRIHLLNIAVHPDFHGMGVGGTLVSNLLGKLSEGRRVRITTEVRERNLDAQLFFKRFGFRATSVLRDYYADSEEDAYVFCHSLAFNSEVLA
jgi:ribosomal-protein-alanine N-acetyltransferase